MKKTLWKQMQLLDRQITALDRRIRIKRELEQPTTLVWIRRKLDQQRKEIRAKMKGAK